MSDKREQYHTHCYRCAAGCIHLVCGNTMLRLTVEDFLSLADAVNALLRQSADEAEPRDEDGRGGSVVM